EQVLRGAVAPTAVAQDQQALCLGIGGAAVFLPPQSDAVTAQFAGVVGGVEMDGGMLARQVVDAVRDQLALTGAAEIVAEGFDGLLGVGWAGAMKIPQQFLLFRIDADHGIAGGLVLLPQ